MKLSPFRMERWQSTYEHRVRHNLSESGVHPLTLGELLEIEGSRQPLEPIRLGYGQSNGSDLLRERIASLYPEATHRSVLVTSGGAEANFAAAWRLLEPGGSAAVLLPNYMQVPGILESFGARIDPVPLREEEGWQPDLDRLRKALDEGARFVVVTNPNNPTGALLSAEAREEIVRAADRHGAWILADEVYRGAEVADDDAEETPTFWGSYPRVLVSHSLSKAYGLPGLRIGWLMAPAEIRDDLWARTDYTTIAPATISDTLAARVLEPEVRWRILARTRGILRRNLEVITRWVEEQGELFEWHPPRAGAICYLRYRAPVDSAELAEYLRVEKDVLVVPGDHFGMDRHLRLGYGPPPEDLREALDRVAEAFRELG